MSFDMTMDFSQIDVRKLGKTSLKGSARKVYFLNEKYAVKVAMNEKGIAQNRAESEVHHEHHMLNSVHYTAPDYKYLVVRRAEKVRHIGTIERMLNKIGERLYDVLEELEANFDILMGDTDRPSAWGIVDGSPVLIDYGFNKDVRKIYWGR